MSTEENPNIYVTDEISYDRVPDDEVPYLHRLTLEEAEQIYNMFAELFPFQHKSSHQEVPPYSDKTAAYYADASEYEVKKIEWCENKAKEIFLQRGPGQNDQSKSLLQIEQELLDSGEIRDEDDLNRLYPNVIGNGHQNVCLCRECAPGEYDQEPDEQEAIRNKKDTEDHYSDLDLPFILSPDDMLLDPYSSYRSIGELGEIVLTSAFYEEVELVDGCFQEAHPF